MLSQLVQNCLQKYQIRYWTTQPRTEDLLSLIFLFNVVTNVFKYRNLALAWFTSVAVNPNVNILSWPISFNISTLAPSRDPNIKDPFMTNFILLTQTCQNFGGKKWNMWFFKENFLGNNFWGKKIGKKFLSVKKNLPCSTSFKSSCWNMLRQFTCRNNNFSNRNTIIWNKNNLKYKNLSLRLFLSYF